MKTAYSCKLFGAQQAYTGIDGCITLLHSVIGCSFGSIVFHASNNMSQLRQTTSAISDDDIVFSGEKTLAKAIEYVTDLYQPELIAVVTGCVSDIIQDDISAVVGRYSKKIKILYQEASGYCGTLEDGYEEAMLQLVDFMDQPESLKHAKPIVNFIGLGADDPHAAADAQALRELLGVNVDLGCVLASCTFKQMKSASQASLNIVLGRGVRLAQEMEKRFGIPYQIIDYPYGLLGAEDVWECLHTHFGIDFKRQREEFIRCTGDGIAPIYSFMQSLYAKPVSVIGTRGRCRGMVRFLSEELGLQVECARVREDVADLDEFIEEICATETAILFGSSFDQEISDKMGIPLFHFDYPAYRRVCITNHPYIGAEGSLHMVETLFNELMAYPSKTGSTISRLRI